MEDKNVLYIMDSSISILSQPVWRKARFTVWNMTDLLKLELFRFWFSDINGREPMQNDQEHFFSDIFLIFYNIIKIII